MIKLLYKPLALIGALVSARVGKTVYAKLWSKIDDEPPPMPGDGRGGAVKLVGAHALEGAVMKGTAAAIDRVTASCFHYLFGAWPAKPPKDKSSKSD